VNIAFFLFHRVDDLTVAVYAATKSFPKDEVYEGQRDTREDPTKILLNFCTLLVVRRARFATCFM